MTKTSSQSPKRKVALIVFDGVTALDVAGPFDVFNSANALMPGNHPGYELIIASPCGGAVTATGGLRFDGTLPLKDLPEDLDTVIVAGGDEAGLRACAESGLPGWLADRACCVRRMASVCTGAFLLAHAGLLNGRGATTHWYSCDILQSMWPEIQVRPDAIFVADPPFYTSAGVTAGIDLCLAFVEHDHGTQLAAAVARNLVVFMRRPGGQAQFSTALKAQQAATPAINRLIAELSDNPCGDLRVQELAARAGMSERTFIRRFHKETGCSPADFVQQLRTERSKTLLQTTAWPLARIAEKAGFGSVFSLHRAFQDKVGITPGEYRARFGSDPSSITS